MTDTEDVDAYLEEAELARRLGDLEAALTAHGRVVEMDSGHTEARLAMAELCRLLGRPAEALEACAAVLALDPGHVGARIEMAEALRLLGRGDEAHAIHDLLLHERPDSPITWRGLAQLLADEDHAAAAEACLRRALALAPGHSASQAALARHLARAGRHEEAIDLYHDAIALAPDQPDPHVGMARSLMALGRWAEAAQRLDRALALDEESIEARLARADMMVMSGRLEDSWEDAEWRWLRPGLGRPDLACPPWDGGEAVGASLLLYAEGSASDAIRMARFIAVVVERGLRPILRVPPRLVSLMAEIPGVERAIRDDRPLPADLDLDLHAPLADLPRLLGFGLDAIPETPWLQAPPRRRRPILAPPDTVLKVGIAWAGRHSAESVPFALFLRLAEIPGVVLFALERGDESAATLADPSLATDLGPSVGDMADMAGRLAELDAVVAADCPTLHLAGAMGKPGLALLPADCHPRWMQETDNSLWHPSLRLIRRSRTETWDAVMDRARSALAQMAEEAQLARTEALRAVTGGRAAQAALLAAHIEPGDLLIDCQAGDGAPLPSFEDVAILAVEPSASRAETLRLERADAPEIEVLAAAIGPDGAPVLASRDAKGGRRVFALPPGVTAPMTTVSLATLLGQRPQWATRRLVLRLGQTGWDEEALAGLAPWPAAVIAFEHRDGAGAAARLSEAGYSLWRFSSPVAAGSVVPFNGEPGAVLALAPGLEPAPRYGEASLPPLPDEIAAARAEAVELSAQGMAHQAGRRLGEAASLYAQALMKDPFAAAANANKGVLMHMAGRREAAVSCYRRSLVRGPAPAVEANLSTALRELRRLDESEAALRRALAAEPGNRDYLYDLALLRRDQGRLNEAMSILRGPAAGRPGAAWTLAQILLAAGELAAGLELFVHRPGPPPPLPDIPVWDGEGLMADDLLVYQDCDAADAVMLARYIPRAAAKGALITLACQPELELLFQDLGGVERVVAGEEEIPPCAVQIALSQLPRLLHAASGPRPDYASYLSLPEGIRPRRVGRDDRLRVGLVWGGRPAERACGLERMLNLAADPDLALIALGGEEAALEIEEIGARTLIEAVVPPPDDLAETAGLIAGLDVVVGGDCAEIHLAAALGKPAWVLLPDAFTWRWPQGRDDSVWHPGARVFRQAKDGSWTGAIARVAAGLKVLAAKKRG